VPPAVTAGTLQAHYAANRANAAQAAAMTEQSGDFQRARALRAPAEPGARVVVVAWHGCTTPKTISLPAVTTMRAERGAHALRGFVASLRQVNDGARVSLRCRSYDTVVCGKAASKLRVDDIALYGSPGTTARSRADFGGTTWAGRGARAWISHVPDVSFGADPTSPGFGAQVFAAGRAGHTDSFALGPPSLRNLAAIVLSDAPLVTRA
jgi:hypothetical protein